MKYYLTFILLVLWIPYWCVVYFISLAIHLTRNAYSKAENHMIDLGVDL